MRRDAPEAALYWGVGKGTGGRGSPRAPSGIYTPLRARICGPTSQEGTYHSSVTNEGLSWWEACIHIPLWSDPGQVWPTPPPTPAGSVCVEAWTQPSRPQMPHGYLLCSPFRNVVGFHGALPVFPTSKPIFFLSREVIQIYYRAFKKEIKHKEKCKSKLTDSSLHGEKKGYHSSILF